MGSCLSKKSPCVSSSPVSVPKPPEKLKSESQLEKKKTEEEEDVVKKEIFIIKHRKSHEIERQQQRSSDEENGEPKKPEQVDKGKNVISSNGVDGGASVRTSSCTKEEVDAILIQCGRLSRGSSTEKAAALSSENGGRIFSGSKRSYDFDGENANAVLDGDDEDERENRRRERHRQSHGRRRTPSREKERDQKQRSGSSRERGGSGGERRVSRSPGRRSESLISTTANSSSNSAGAIKANSSRPGKMVSVPATVSSLGMDKSNNGEAVKRIQVKRNVGGSPRSRSPARMRASNENQNVNCSQNQLSRSNSRKAEHSPNNRRNPLAQIDTNIISQKPNADNNKTVQVSENRNNNSNNLITTNVNCKNHQEQHPMAQETYGIPSHVALNVISSSGPENPKNQPLTRSRSSRLSRDLDIINPETLSNPNTSSSYTALLLEDIQNFHQMNTPPPAFTLPPCVTKACSILEAVADLNSSTGSNLSSTPFSEQTNKIKKSKPEIIKDIPILESEVVANNNDLMEPSFHKYVTVRRGTSGGEEYDMEEQESSGSNSFVTGSQQHWVSSSCWEPNSAESTDRWTCSSSSRSVTRQAMSESGRVVGDESGKKVKKRDSDNQLSGIGQGRIGSRSSHIAVNAAVLT